MSGRELLVEMRLYFYLWPATFAGLWDLVHRPLVSAPLVAALLAVAAVMYLRISRDVLRLIEPDRQMVAVGRVAFALCFLVAVLPV